MESRPIIALVGRPNVGKSTLFNRLVGRREAITSHLPGTTRDRHFGVMDWFGQSWTVVDTAGLLLGDKEDDLTPRGLLQAMEEQVAVAVEEATVIAVVVDVKEGLHPMDVTLVNLLRKKNKPMVILANKADNQTTRMETDVFQQLGIEPIFAVSGIHGSGMGDLIDYLKVQFPSSREAVSRSPRITFLGRPNVGKSTLMNQFLGQKRMIVSDVPGTTRDSIAQEVTLPSGAQFTLVDTAGIRRRGQIGLGVESFSLFRTLKAINASDIVVLLLTIEEPPTRGDAHVAMYALEANKTVILALNKADLAVEPIAKLPLDKQRVLGLRYLKRFVFLQRLPFCFISAQTGMGIDTLTRLVTETLAKQKPKPQE